MSLRVNHRTGTVAAFLLGFLAVEILDLRARFDKSHARRKRFINFDAVLLIADGGRFGDSGGRCALRRRDVRVLPKLPITAEVNQTSRNSDRDERRS